MAHDLPLDHACHKRQVELWETVRRETGGRVDVQVFGNYQLGSQTAMLSQLRLGAIHFLLTTNGIYSEFIPVAAIDSLGFIFDTPTTAWTAMDGPLGDYLKQEFAAKGLYRFKTTWDIGMREITSSNHGVASAPDFGGMKLRVATSKIAVDLLQTLGASPVSLSGDQIYTAMQTHVIDGTEGTLSGVIAFKWYEVQKYLSMTNHMYSGEYVAANADTWKSLPSDLQATIERNMLKYARLERADNQGGQGKMLGDVRRIGMEVVTTDANSMHAKLGSYYTRWKDEFGTQAWVLLESAIGRRG